MVRALDKSGNEEDNTNTRSAVADAANPQPATNLVAESHPDGRIELKWTLSASKDAAAYNLYWDNAQVDIDYSKSLVRVNDPNVSWTSDKLRDGVVYRFVVRCQDQAGNEEENTNFVSARADATPPGATLQVSERLLRCAPESSHDGRPVLVVGDPRTLRAVKDSRSPRHQGGTPLDANATGCFA